MLSLYKLASVRSSLNEHVCVDLSGITPHCCAIASGRRRYCGPSCLFIRPFVCLISSLGCSEMKSCMVFEDIFEKLKQSAWGREILHSTQSLEHRDTTTYEPIVNLASVNL